MSVEATRRTLLATLGLAPVGIGAEAFVAKADAHEGPALPALGFRGASCDVPWEERREQIALALEKLAAEVRADRIGPLRLELNTVLENDSWANYELTFKFEYFLDQGKATS